MEKNNKSGGFDFYGRAEMHQAAMQTTAGVRNYSLCNLPCESLNIHCLEIVLCELIKAQKKANKYEAFRIFKTAICKPMGHFNGRREKMCIFEKITRSSQVLEMMLCQQQQIDLFVCCSFPFC